DDRPLAERLASGEERELDDEREAGDDAALLSDQRAGRRGRPARRDHVIDDHVTCVRTNRIRVHLEVVEAVLELVADADSLPRQLAALADEMHRQAEPVRERRTEDEAARLDCEDVLGAKGFRALREALDRLAETCRMLQERSDVL